VSVTTRTATEY